MVVVDSPLFPPGMMIRVRVTNMNGMDVIADVGKDWKCDKVKLSLEQLLDLGQPSADPVKDSLMLKLVLVRTSSTLADDSTLAQQGVKDNDELLLLKRRTTIPLIIKEADRQREDRKVVDIATIRKATSHLSKKNHDQPEEEPTSTPDFQSELRRILISLIEASQRILCLNPEAAKIFKQAEDMLNEAPSRKTGLTEANVKQLTDMGFPENRAKKALLLNQQSVVSAMEWLLTNESDPDIDKPLPGMDLEEENSADEAEVQGAEGGAPETAQAAPDDTESPRFKNILETIRAFQRREFRPNPRALHNLLEMGFSEKEAIHALRQARNSQDAACEWLLSDRQDKPDNDDQGLDVNSPVYKAILAHPSVQLGLNSPRCLLAFLQMLENPISATQWLHDPETGPLLMQISRIYHSEKLSPFTTGPVSSVDDSS